MKKNHRKILITSLLLATISTCPLASYGDPCQDPALAAEGWTENNSGSSAAGGGRYGANRVVHSPPNVPCGGVKGVFSEPTFTLGNPYHRDKPSYYLGLKGTDVIMDTGIQWEKGAWTDSSGIQHDGWWSPFMNIVSHGCRKTYNVVPVFRIAKGSLGAQQLSLSVQVDNDGLVDIASRPNGSTEELWSLRSKNPHWNDSNGTIDAASIRARRVIAMTQGQGYYAYHDGATIHCEFSGGEINRIGTNAQGHYYLNSSEPWPGPDSFNAKDYNPKDKSDHGDNIGYPQTPWVVDFGGVYRRNPQTGADPSLSEEVENARYSAEIVGINLLPYPAKLDRKNAPKPGGSS